MQESREGEHPRKRIRSDEMAEPKKGVNRGNAGKGRPKGARNKTTIAAKNAIAAAAEKLGGVDRLVDWAKEDPANERVFWGTVFPKLIPLDLNAGGEINVVHKIERSIVRTKNSDS